MGQAALDKADRAGEWGLDPAEFGVTLTSGVVTISGQMPRPDAALELLARIRHTEGVVAIRNRLAVGNRTAWPGQADGRHLAGGLSQTGVTR
jgi:hypothetical protein